MYKGKWSDSQLTAVTIAKLMGCSNSKAKDILRTMKGLYGDITEDMIGMAIQEVRNQADLRVIKDVS